MANFRVGMWVKVKSSQKIGIYVTALDDVAAEVHLVDALGNTELIIQALNSELVQASFMEIPEARRPDIAVARPLGY